MEQTNPSLHTAACAAQAQQAEIVLQNMLTRRSVRRYQSYLKRKDRRAYRQSDREALARYRDRLRLFTTVLRLK